MTGVTCYTYVVKELGQLMGIACLSNRNSSASLSNIDVTE